MTPVMAPRLMAMLRPIFSRLTSCSFRRTTQGRRASTTSMIPPITGFMLVTLSRQKIRSRNLPMKLPPRYCRTGSSKQLPWTGR